MVRVSKRGRGRIGLANGFLISWARLKRKQQTGHSFVIECGDKHSPILEQQVSTAFTEENKMLMLFLGYTLETSIINSYSQTIPV